MSGLYLISIILAFYHQLDIQYITQFIITHLIFNVYLSNNYLMNKMR